MHISYKWIAVVLVVTCLASVVLASVSFTPPGGKAMYVASIVLTPTAAAGKGTATATMVCKTDLTTGMLTIQANGLDPKKAYTVWLIKTTTVKGQKPKVERTGLGKAPFALKVNAKGFGNLMADIPNCKAAVMQTLEVLRHTGANAKDTKNAVVVFTGDLKKMVHDKQA